MANATLTVNEFRSLTLPTEVPVTWPLSYTVLLILSFLLLCAFIALCLLYLFFSKKFASKSRIQTLDKMAVRKKARKFQYFGLFFGLGGDHKEATA